MLSPSVPAMAVVKKYFISNRPRGVSMYLLEVTRLTVNSCMSMVSATDLQVHRPQIPDAEGEEHVLLADDFGGDLEDGLGPLVEALGQPVGGLQAIADEEALFVASRS